MPSGWRVGMGLTAPGWRAIDAPFHGSVVQRRCHATLLPSLPDVSVIFVARRYPGDRATAGDARVLLPLPVHLSAEQVQQCANHYTSGLSRATVYNTLKLFTARGLLRELAVEPGKTMFDSIPATSPFCITAPPAS